MWIIFLACTCAVVVAVVIIKHVIQSLDGGLGGGCRISVTHVYLCGLGLLLSRSFSGLRFSWTFLNLLISFGQSCEGQNDIRNKTNVKLRTLCLWWTPLIMDLSRINYFGFKCIAILILLVCFPILSNVLICVSRQSFCYCCNFSTRVFLSFVRFVFFALNKLQLKAEPLPPAKKQVFNFRTMTTTLLVSRTPTCTLSLSLALYFSYMYIQNNHYHYHLNQPWTSSSLKLHTKPLVFIPPQFLTHFRYNC